MTPLTDTDKVLLHVMLAHGLWPHGGAGWTYHMGCAWYLLLKEIA